MISGLRPRFRWSSAGLHDFMRKLAPPCGYGPCGHAGSLWQRARWRSRGVRMKGVRYCQTECLELALAEILARARPAPHRSAISSHRIPLGLLLLSRQQLTAAQLRSALKAQRTAGCGKIGAWLQELGFVTEPQVTAALARQWCCPVLLTGTPAIAVSRIATIPALLLESFQMMPVEFTEATGTLLVAFSEGIDYTVLYAIEQMLGYRTEACLACPSTLREGLRTLASQRNSSDIVFDGMEDTAECARIISSYSAKLEAVEVRVARCGAHLWVRFERLRQETVNLVLTASREAASGRHISPPKVLASAM